MIFLCFRDVKSYEEIVRSFSLLQAIMLNTTNVNHSNALIWS